MPSTTPLVEGFHPGEFLISEGNGRISRETVTIASGADLTPGTVLGQIARGAETSAAGTNTGNGVLGAVTLAAAALVGVYTLKVTKAAANAGDFEVLDPNGEVMGLGTVGVAFNPGGLSFTLADGATDFVVGDSFTMMVAAGSGKYTLLNLSGIDGTQHAAAILFGHAYAASADVPSAIVKRLAEVNPDALTWPAGITDPQKAVATAELAKLFIILRP